jgi:hypothetical protein
VLQKAITDSKLGLSLLFALVIALGYNTFLYKLVLAAPDDPAIYDRQWGNSGGQITLPHGVATDASGNVYVTDTTDQT